MISASWTEGPNWNSLPCTLRTIWAHLILSCWLLYAKIYKENTDWDDKKKTVAIEKQILNSVRHILLRSIYWFSWKKVPQVTSVSRLIHFHCYGAIPDSFRLRITILLVCRSPWKSNKAIPYQSNSEKVLSKMAATANCNGHSTLIGASQKCCG